MKSVFTLLLFLTYKMSFAACPTIALPETFEEHEAFISIGTDMHLKSGNGTFAEIQERTLNLTPTFELLTPDYKKVARAQERFLSWGTTIDITDCEKNKIGMVKELIWESIFSVSTKYEIYNASNALIGSSDKVEFFSTDFTIKTPQGKVAFKMHRPTFNFMTDTWKVTVVDKSLIDSRLVLMIPAFKTAADNKKREEDKEDKDD